MKQFITRLLREEEGLTTVEYAIAGGLVGAGLIAAFGNLGDAVRTVIEAITGALGNIQIT